MPASTSAALIALIVLCAGSVMAAVPRPIKDGAARPVQGATVRPHPSIRVLPLPAATATSTPSAAPASTGDPLLKTIAAALGERVAARREARHAARGASPGLTRGQHERVEQLRDQLGALLDVHIRTRTGTPAAIRMPRATGTPRPPNEAEDAKQARAFLRANRGLLRIDRPDDELVLAGAAGDGLQRRQLRFAQRYRGVPVWPANLLVQLDPAGQVEHMTGAFVPTPANIDPNPEVTAGDAEAAARGAVRRGRELRLSSQDLVIFAPGDRPARLAWKTRLAGALHERWLVLVDAGNGAVIERLNEVAHTGVVGSGVDVFGQVRALDVWNNAGTHLMVDTSKPMFDPTSDPPSPANTRGAIYGTDIQNRTEGDLFHVTSANPNAWPIDDAVSASFGLSQTYDYFLDRHGRNSLDGNGGTLFSIVRYGVNYRNAFWNGQSMVFGDGAPYAGALDVVAHELSHGVTENTAGLVYRNQSGALNEAFSDIFGEGTEARTNGAPDWLTGAQLGVPLRNLADPGALEMCCGRGFPSDMTEFLQANDPFLDNFTDRDNGGVHLNSSIINRTFYLLAEGLPGGGIGMPDAERIFYRTLTTKLLPNSQFIDARLGAIASAEELFGAGSVQAQKTAAAFDATLILGGEPPDGTPPTYPGTDGADSVLFGYRDNSLTFRLGRRETALNDPPLGVQLAAGAIDVAPPSVSGDGGFAVYVSDADDICLIETDGTDEECLGFEGRVGSVAMAPQGNVFGIVLLDEATGERIALIGLIDLAAGDERILDIQAPAPDGEPVNTVAYADSMDFTADGRFIIYDAFSRLDLGGDAVGSWNIYALDLATETVYTLVDPAPGLSFAYPSLGQRSDSLLTFDVYDEATNRSTVVTANLVSGDVAIVDDVAGFGEPGYNGDDTALVYSREDTGTATGSSLYRQALGADHLTPVGTAAEFLDDADVGKVYRRGPFTPPHVPLVSALLPLSRSVQVGSPATVFAVVINAGNTRASECNIIPITGLPAAFVFQTTNPATNALTGTPNSPVDIAAGAAQTFLISITPSAPVVPTTVQLSYSCTNTDPANIVTGVNTLQFSADTTPVADIIALAATVTNDGVAVIPAVNELGFFSVATVNVGAGANVEVTADTGGSGAPVALSLCQTDPSNGSCLAPPAPAATVFIDADATPTFAVFVQALAAVPFDPAGNRVFLRFREGGVLRGATSVAVRTP